MGGGVVLGLPPHAVRPPSTENARRARTRCLRCLRAREASPTSTPANTNSVVLNGEPGADFKRALSVVATVTVTGTFPEAAVRVAEVGFTVQVVPAGAPEQVSATAPLNPWEDRETL